MTHGDAQGTLGGLRRSFSRTDVGRQRTANEDALYAGDEVGLYVVADGMGGHEAGEVASEMAVDTVIGMVKRGINGVALLLDPLEQSRVDAACRYLESAIQAATYMVFGMAQQDKKKKGMGTTITALLVLGDYAVLAQVGDSRIYRVRKGQAEQVTNDHTLVGEQLRAGTITREQAKLIPNNIVMRAVGSHDYVEVDTGVLSIQRGDRLLLCSDGLHGYLEEGEIPKLVAGDGEEAVKRLVDLANERGGQDNISAIVVTFDPKPPPLPLPL